MPPDPLSSGGEEDEYASSEDSDFAPEDVARPDRGDSSGESGDDDDDDETRQGNHVAGVKKKRRRPQTAGGEEFVEEDAGFENSGDEAIIQKGKKKQRRAGRGHAADGEEDEGGEGGLVKTRRQRALEKQERKATAVKGPITIDVDAVWAQMTSSAVTPNTGQQQRTLEASGGVNGPDGQTDSIYSKQTDDATKNTGATAAVGANSEQPGMIKIKRTYNFAGKIHTEEKLVARDSAEAKLYLASLGGGGGAAADAGTGEEDEQQEPPRRLPRAAFRSAFEPRGPDQAAGPRRADLNLGIGVLRQARERAAVAAAARKLNTVEKSRMDWAGFVDKEGIKDELELAGRSKDSFAARQDFLARSEAVRQEDARRARVAASRT